jgi:hypothetical protein
LLSMFDMQIIRRQFTCQSVPTIKDTLKEGWGSRLFSPHYRVFPGWKCHELLIHHSSLDDDAPGVDN